MWDKIIEFLCGKPLPPMKKEIILIGSLLQHLEENYVKDGNARNAVIDTWIEQLQKMKYDSVNVQQNVPKQG